MTTAPDHWASGEPYERYMGRWSRILARAVVTRLAPKRGLSWLDVGCGTGALSAAILALADPASIRAIDASEGFIAYAATRQSDPRVTYEVGNALQPPFEEASADMAASGLMLNFVPDPIAALQAAWRALRPGGRLAFYVWDYADRMEMLRYFWDSAVALNPQARSRNEGQRFPMTTPDDLKRLGERAGLSHVDAVGVEGSMVFADFADYWTPFLGGQGPAPTYVSGLGADDKQALMEDLQKKLPFQADGSIHLVGRVWVLTAER